MHEIGAIKNSNERVEKAVRGALPLPFPNSGAKAPVARHKMFHCNRLWRINYGGAKTVTVRSDVIAQGRRRRARKTSARQANE
jgi:hypothetical protein